MERAEHWLWRLDADAWLRAARAELAAGESRIESRRVAVTHARRGAGMAINAVLVAEATRSDDHSDDHGDTILRWGRSYLDHLRALADADEARAAPLAITSCTAAAQLLAIPVVPAASGLLQLGRSPHSAAEQALAAGHALLDDCAAVVAHLSPRTA